MTERAFLAALPGGRTLLDWFGDVPHFHDAEVIGLVLGPRGRGILRLHAWRTTDEADARGVLVLDRHAVVTITLDAVEHVALDDFDLPGIVLRLDIAPAIVGKGCGAPGTGVELRWTGAYGVEGVIRARRARVRLRPGQPAAPSPA